MAAVFSNSLSAPVWLKFEPVGSQFYHYVHSLVTGLDSRHSTDTNASTRDDVENEENYDEDSSSNILLNLDPTQWKDQDHYAMLGLAKVRFKASPKDIRKAYQQQALIHHPDKHENKEDTTFKCIQIAYEILSDPKKRRAFDSVDPTFSDTIPVVSAHSKENFYDTFDSVFKENARWSTVQPVPSLGGPDASLDEIENFYTFWYNFTSWREFSFLDEENLDKAECREERRWMDKQNKAMRVKRKKEEMARIRQLVDNSYACDPRVKFFKEKEKEEKESQKKAKQQAAKTEALQKEMERKQKEEEEKRMRDLEEEKQRQVTAQQKQEREAYKKVLKRERKELRSLCKDKEYFSESAEEKIRLMEIIDHLCEALPLHNLQSLNQCLAGSTTNEGRTFIEREMIILKEKENEEERKAASATKKAQTTSDCHWTREEVQLLIKAVTMYPAGTAKRWEVIAQFVNAHSPEKCSEKTSAHVIEKVKSLRKLDSSKREDEAFSQFTQKHSSKVSVTSAPTTRDVSDVSGVWTAEEQKTFEAALRKYPVNTPQRWDKIASELKSRSKEECIARFKELVARVKAKKQ